MNTTKRIIALIIAFIVSYGASKYVINGYSLKSWHTKCSITSSVYFNYEKFDTSYFKSIANDSIMSIHYTMTNDTTNGIINNPIEGVIRYYYSVF